MECGRGSPSPDFYARAGQIGRDAQAGAVLDALRRVYQYWIALSDCDGVRIDTAKHASFEASRNFCGALREYAERIVTGKDGIAMDLPPAGMALLA